MVVLADDQERAGVESGLFRLPKTLKDRRRAVNPLRPIASVAAAATVCKHLAQHRAP
jgi:hypothetical protein